MNVCSFFYMSIFSRKQTSWNIFGHQEIKDTEKANGMIFSRTICRKMGIITWLSHYSTNEMKGFADSQENLMHEHDYMWLMNILWMEEILHQSIYGLSHYY